MREDRDYRRMPDDIKATQLVDNFTKGLVLGLPGAGKTTILKHMAYQTMKANHHLPILFIKCGDVLTENLPGSDFSDPGAAIRFLVGCFLFPRSKFANLTVSQHKVWDTTTSQLKKAWEDDCAVILIDALDESRDGVARIIVAIYQALGGDLHNRDVNPIGRRIFLSSRPAQLDETRSHEKARFYVNPLGMGHIQQMARYFLKEEPQALERFNQDLPQSPYAIKVGGTPLTALLIITWHRVYQGFELRYATYDFLMKFVLYKTWEKMKQGAVAQEYGDIETYLQAVRDDAFLSKHHNIDHLYKAFCQLAYDTFFRKANQNRKVRSFGVKTLQRRLEKYIENLQEYRDDDKATLIKEWRENLVGNHLVVKAGRDEYQFIHQTVMEFLAARHMLLEGQKTWTKAVSHQYETLETWPIGCSHEYEQAYEILAFLGQQDLSLESTLGYRCLAETEAVEQRALKELDFEDEVEEQEQEFEEKGDAAKSWIYGRIQELFSEEDEEAITTWRDRIEVLPGLNVGKLLKYLPEHWDQDLTLITQRKALLEALTTTPKWIETPDPIKPKDEKNTALAAPYLARYGEIVGPTLQQIFGVPRMGHPNLVTCVAINPITGVIASGGGNELRLWDPDTSFCIAVLKGHTYTVAACAWAPDGTALASAALDHTLRLWAPDGTPQAVLEGHADRVAACAWAPDGTALASASYDKTLRLWAPDGRPQAVLEGHTDPVVACAWAPDGRFLVSGSRDQTLRVWDPSTGRQLASINLVAVPFGLSFRPDTLLVTLANHDGSLTELDLARL